MVLTDLKQGDVFFMCTDGVIEAFTDEKIESVFSDSSDGLEERTKKIKETCQSISRDNYSAMFIELGNVDTNIIEKIKRLAKN